MVSPYRNSNAWPSKIGTNEIDRVEGLGRHRLRVWMDIATESEGKDMSSRVSTPRFSPGVKDDRTEAGRNS